MTNQSDSADTPGNRRRPTDAGAVLLAIPVVAAMTVAMSSVVLRGDLPDRVAVHWTGGGTANNFMSLQATTALFFMLVVGLGLGMVVAAGRVPGRTEARGLAATGTGLAVFLTTLHVGTLLVNRGTDGVDVPFPGWALGVGALVGVLVGLVGRWLAPEPRGGDHVELDATLVAMVPGEAVVWTGGAAAPGGYLVLPIGAVVLGGVLAVLTEPMAGAIAAAAGLLAATMLRVRIVVGPAGLQVRGGPFGVVRTTVPLRDITSVRTEHVNPMSFGGYGYRVKVGVRAVVVRTGPGLRVEREGRADLVVTVDGAADAVGVLRAHLALAA